MITCKQCQNTFLIAKTRKTFCSHTCQAKWAITRANQFKTPKKKTGKILNCIVCNKEFYVRAYRANKECTKYCSRSCLAKNHLSQFNAQHGFQKTHKPRHKYKTIVIDGKQVREHRWIMEQYLGRKLEPWEHVHHINDDSSDNRIENLEVLSNSEHQKKEHAFRKKITSSS